MNGCVCHLPEGLEGCAACAAAYEAEKLERVRAERLEELGREVFEGVRYGANVLDRGDG